MYGRLAGFVVATALTRGLTPALRAALAACGFASAGSRTGATAGVGRGWNRLVVVGVFVGLAILVMHRVGLDIGGIEILHRQHFGYGGRRHVAGTGLLGIRLRRRGAETGFGDGAPLVVDHVVGKGFVCHHGI